MCGVTEVRQHVEGNLKQDAQPAQEWFASATCSHPLRCQIREQLVPLCCSLATGTALPVYNKVAFSGRGLMQK